MTNQSIGNNASPVAASRQTWAIKLLLSLAVLAVLTSGCISSRGGAGQDSGSSSGSDSSAVQRHQVDDNFVNPRAQHPQMQ